MIGKGRRPFEAGARVHAESGALPVPGKRTLTEALAPAAPVAAPVIEEQSTQTATPPYKLPRLDLAPRTAQATATSGLPRLDLAPRAAQAGTRAHGGSGSTTRAAAPVRVADAARELNAVLKVVVYSRGRVVKRWETKARWEGPLPQRYTGSLGPAGWKWDEPLARQVRVDTDARGQGGKSLESWAGPGVDRIVLYASEPGAVAIDEDAEQDERAPGHAVNPQDAGAGSTPAVKPQEKGSSPAQAKQGEGGAAPPAGERSGAGEPAEAFGPSEKDEELADAFEAELGLGADDEISDELSEDEAQAGPAAAGGQAARAGGPGADPDGRKGPDTRVGGTGPGGARARLGGRGEGSEGGGKDGSEQGSRDGAKGGAPDGMYGGEGQLGDGGVPSAVALFGGLVSVPVAIRGLVEIALIASSADVTGAGKALFKRGIRELASVPVLRQEVARRARVAAMRETQAVMKSLASNKRTAAAFARLTEAEKLQLMRITYWELQRKFFQGYLAAARQAKAEAKAMLRTAPSAPAAQSRLRTAELAEEVATVPPVAGRLPQNHELAGKPYPNELLPAAYRQQGLRFKETGYPDFEPYALTLPNKQKYVEITYTGSRSSDSAAATAKAGFTEVPARYTWHHSEELGRMYLVPKDLHAAVKHTGGVATHKHATGELTYGR